MNGSLMLRHVQVTAMKLKMFRLFALDFSAFLGFSMDMPEKVPCKANGVVSSNHYYLKKVS